MHLDKTLSPFFSIKEDLFSQIMALRGECFRAQKGRLTQRITLGEQTYFIKQHRGASWKEIFKNILQCRWPTISAKPEWQAINKLASIGVNVPKLLGYGERGLNPLSQESFVLMQDLKPIISLEDLGKDWQIKKPSFAFKCDLIRSVATIAKQLHENGINHRDFYLCHFLLDTSIPYLPHQGCKLFLIDLHRAQIRRLTPTRWIIKDLAGLYFSSRGMTLSKRDAYRFMKIYRGQPLATIMKTEKAFWEKVKRRGDKLYHDHTNG